MMMERIIFAILALGIVSVGIAVYNFIQIQYIKLIQERVAEVTVHNQLAINLLLDEIKEKLDDINKEPKHNTSDGEDK